MGDCCEVLKDYKSILRDDSKEAESTKIETLKEISINLTDESRENKAYEFLKKLSYDELLCIARAISVGRDTFDGRIGEMLQEEIDSLGGKDKFLERELKTLSSNMSTRDDLIYYIKGKAEYRQKEYINAYQNNF